MARQIITLALYQDRLFFDQLRWWFYSPSNPTDCEGFARTPYKIQKFYLPEGFSYHPHYSDDGDTLNYTDLIIRDSDHSRSDKIYSDGVIYRDGIVHVLLSGYTNTMLPLIKFGDDSFVLEPVKE